MKKQDTDLQTRKLRLLNIFIWGIRDEKVFRRIELTIDETKDHHPHILSEKELLNRAKKSKQDYKEGKVVSQDKLEDESRFDIRQDPGKIKG